MKIAFHFAQYDVSQKLNVRYIYTGFRFEGKKAMRRCWHQRQVTATSCWQDTVVCRLIITKPFMVTGMMTSSTFSASLAFCTGNSPVTGELPSQRPVTRSFDVFFDLRLNKRLSKQSIRWWFETPTRSLWRHRNIKPSRQSAKQA